METPADLAALLLRGVLGAVMIAHGWNHIWGGGGIDGTTRWFASLGMRPARLHAWLASVTELVAGALLVVGFATPLAAAAVVGVIVVAWVTNHRDAGFFVFNRPTEGWEYLLTLLVVAAAVGALGSGSLSVDGALGWGGRVVGPAGTALVLGLGGLGAALILATAWSPSDG